MMAEIVSRRDFLAATLAVFAAPLLPALPAPAPVPAVEPAVVTEVSWIFIDSHDGARIRGVQVDLGTFRVQLQRFLDELAEVARAHGVEVLEAP